MVLEWLKVKVPAHLREQYVQKDAEIWTTALQQYPGFMGKEVWISPDDPTEVSMVIRWASREQWKSIPVEELDAIAQKFDQALGFDYDMIEEKEYHVRKFAQQT